MNKLVCKCNNVYEDDIEKFYKLYPDMSLRQMKSVFKIGGACGCCNMDECPIIDIKFDTVVNKLKNNTNNT